MPMPTKTPLISHPPESFVLKLESINTNNDHIFLGKPKSNDKELDVFAAEKYFNEVDNNSPKLVVAKNLKTDHHAKKDELPLDIFGNKPKPAKTTTKSIRSESSWNSRSSLLQTVPKNQPKSKNKKSFFACNNCSCVGKKSVDVDKSKTGHFVTDYGSVKLNEPEHEKIKPGAHFTFPVFNGDQSGKIKTRVEEKDIIFTKRSKSLKVFDGPENEKLGSGLEKKMAMMTWTIPSISSEMRDDESDASDASSDLFEIESFTRGGAHTEPWTGAAASDGCKKSPTVMTSYAPSEASVEWSVMTASVADFGELNGSDLNPSNNPGPKKIGSFKEMPRLRTSGILSGCTSKKAIMTKSRDEIKSSFG